MMGLTLTGNYISLFFAVQLAYFLQAVGATGRCNIIFQGFSDCLLRLGENMVNYPKELDDRDNLRTICSYWNDFNICAKTALADCPEEATDLWVKLQKESRKLEFRGSLFELCGGDNGAPRSTVAIGVTVLLAALPMLITWLAF